jgi:hypothetical protein
LRIERILFAFRHTGSAGALARTAIQCDLPREAELFFKLFFAKNRKELR